MRNERETQNRVIKVLKEELGYNYLGSFEDRDCNSNIEEEYLVEFLKNKYSDALIKKAIVTLKKTAILSANEDLYGPNKAVYSLLRYGVKEKEESGENSITINLIDWKNPENISQVCLGNCVLSAAYRGSSSGWCDMTRL